MIDPQTRRILRAAAREVPDAEPTPAVVLHGPAPTTRDALALAGGLAFAAVLLSPLRHYWSSDRTAKNSQDSFPLSTYPMFSEDRKGRTRVPHVVGFTAEGERVLPHHLHFGAGGLNQVRKQIARMVRQGRAVEVAQRYADALHAERDRSTRGSSPGAQRRRREAPIVQVEVVRSRFEFDAYYAGDRQPLTETVHARCIVGGTAVAVDQTRTSTAPTARIEDLS